MTEQAHTLLQQAMQLAPKDRAELAAKLVASVNQITEAASAWATLIRERARRVLAHELGTTTYLRNAPKTMVRFELDAEVDLERAATWYADQPGQMDAFLAEVEERLEEARVHPASFGFHGGVPQSMGVRRVLLREFPYTLGFVRVRTEVRVLAVAHNFRMPSDGDISIDALVTVEDWLVRTGVRALSALTAVSAGVSHLVAH